MYILNLTFNKSTRSDKIIIIKMLPKFHSIKEFTSLNNQFPSELDKEFYSEKVNE